MSFAAAASKIRGWRHDPIKFVRQAFGAEPDDWQAEVLLAYAGDPVVNPHNLQRIALKASKGPGKSTVLSWMGWHFLTVYSHPKIAATSITGDNLRDNLWTEYALWQNRSPFHKAAFTWNAERIVANDHPETWFATARAWPKSADPQQQADALAGLHGDFVMFQLDESGGMPNAVAAAAEGALANAEPGTGRIAKLIQAGNPTMLSGPLYRACTVERQLWWIKEISGDPDDPKRAPRVSKQWAREQIEKYGRDSPYVLVNVFGKFPPAQSNALLGVEDVTAACRRTIAEHAYLNAPKVLGVDVARFGDDRTVLFPRQGLLAYQPKVFRNLDTMEVVGQVTLAISRWNPDAVFIDQTGVGAGVVDRLRQLGHQVVGVESAAKATRPEPRLANKRAEMWWSLAEWVKGGACLPDIPELISEATAPTYFFDASGRLQIESKQDLKDRGLPSPDLADALALTFAFPVQRKEASRQSVHAVATEYDPYQERL